MMEKVIIFQKKRIQGARTQNGGMSGRNVEYKRFMHRRQEHLNLSEWAGESLKAYMDSSACSEMEDKQDRMGKMQREKGKRGERELAGILRDYGYNCRRGQQYCGTSGDADVIGLPDVHIEVKRVENLRLRKALQQSSRDARAGEIPVVMHRRNRESWKVSMWMENFRKIYSDDVFDDLKPCTGGPVIPKEWEKSKKRISSRCGHFIPWKSRRQRWIAG